LTEADFWYREAGSAYPVIFVTTLHGGLSLSQGRLRAARELFAQAGGIAARQFATEQQGQIVPGLMSATIYYELNDLEAASRLLARWMPQIEDTQSWVDLYVLSHLTASFLEYHYRGIDAALEILARGLALGERRHFPRLILSMKLQRAELLGRAGRADEALGQLAEVGIRAPENCLEWGDSRTWPERNFAGLALARSCLLQGDHATALQIADTLAAECQARGALRYLLRHRLLQALIRQRCEKHEDSVCALQSAFAIAVPEEASRVFLDEGEAMHALLKDFMRESGVRQLPAQTVSFIAGLLSAFASDRTAGERPAGMSILSPREYHVLVALARGHSNKIIARQLDLTENTVKFHLRSIYEKLGVSTRAMASAVAHEMGLILPSGGGG